MTTVLLVYFLLFFGAAFVWPTARLWRRDRINALVLPRDDSPQGVIATWFRLLIVGLLVGILALSMGVPSEALGRLTWLEQPILAVVGWGLLAASFVWIVVAQAQMGRSWRIGIDKGSRPPLVREGLFGHSRNPIFLGMRANLAGLFLVLPNSFTLAALLLAEALIQVQVRHEEAHLSAAFGEEYDSYRAAVRRWI